jgi:PAS domain S-box-containing protein
MSPDSIPAFLTGDSEMAAHMRGFDWAATPLGAPHAWPSSLQAAVGLMLGSGHPMLIWWGAERIQLYNDAHRPSLPPERHPASLGLPGAAAWPEHWDSVAPQIARVLEGGGGAWHENAPVSILRGGRIETASWNYSLTAINDPDAPGGIGGVLLISHDTTATQRALQAAEAQVKLRTAERDLAFHHEKLLRAAFEATEHLNAVLALDGTVIAANPRFLGALGAPRDEIEGRKLWDCPGIAATPGLGARLQAAVPRAAAGDSARHEVFFNTPGGPLMFEVTLRPAREASGPVYAITAEAVELTHWRAAEEKLRQAQKMEAVGQLTGGLAHDFNNLLTGISGSLDLLKTRIAQGRAGEAERYIGAAQSSADRAAALTHRLLAFSRRQTLDPRPVHANTLIAGMEDQIRRVIGPRITLRTRLRDGLWTISCDARQLENAILNLCLNARDAMPDGGMLTIETDNLVLDAAQARARDMQPGPYTGIFVTDDGIGMSPEVASRAFDPFFTTKPIGLGTGLGLSMIYGFTQQSGGQVRIHTAEGQGTTMRLFLPRLAEGRGLEPSAPSQAGTPQGVKSGETVLVVDDEPAVRMLVVEVLEELGYATLEAGDGAAGLKILQSPARVDLLISDVGLPGGMNGRQMADAARQHRPELKVMFITGYAETAVVGNGSLGPGMEVMTKPFPLDTLAARIKAMLEG